MPTLHPLCADHAVFQRDRTVPVRGTGVPGTTVTVHLAGATGAASVLPDGRWTAWLPPLPAGGPHQLEAVGNDGVARAMDVLVGEVLLCSGQSNMEWPLHQCRDGADLARQLDGDAVLRLFQMPRRVAPAPRADAPAAWAPAAGSALAGFSGVALFGARALRERLGVPVGLIQAAWGGTNAEAWISAEALHALPWLQGQWQQAEDLRRAQAADPAGHAARMAAIQTGFAARFRAWRDAVLVRDGGEDAGWQRADADLATWAERAVPGHWPDAQLGNHEGVVWFACDVTVPPHCAGAPAVLHLGEIDNEDTTWVNGTRVGSIDMMAGPLHWCMQRDYAVAPGVLRAGRNRITVRVFDYGGRGGFAGGPHGLTLVSGNERVALPATWRIRVGAAPDAPRPAWPPLLNGATNEHTPAALFDGMIAPLLPVGCRAVWWYQGENNTDRAQHYHELLGALIRDWQRRLAPPDAADGEVGFHIVQLAPFHPPISDAGARSPWAELREAQTRCLRLPGVAQVVILDAGDANDIHPQDKRTPGERLAAQVLRRFDPTLRADGPRPLGLEREPGRLRLRFDAPLATRDGAAPGHVAICGADRRWVWAQTQLEGDAVVAWHPAVPEPRDLRYAWADNPAAANMVDAERRPAWPYRSDDGG